MKRDVDRFKIRKKKWNSSKFKQEKQYSLFQFKLVNQ